MGAGRRSTITKVKASTSDSTEAMKQRLMGIANKGNGAFGNEVWKGGFFGSIALSGIQISHAECGRILGSFRIPAYLTDSEGNWAAGAIAALMDVFGAAAIMTAVGHIKISVDFDISYFYPAKINEEVEMSAGIVEHKGKLTAVMVEVRKKGDGRMVALGRQWMASSVPSDPRARL